MDSFSDIIVREYYPQVLGRVRSFVPTEEDAEDVTQDVFLTASRTFDSYRAKSGLFTWFYKITTCRIADYYRKRSRECETIAIGEMDFVAESPYSESMMYDIVEQLPRNFQGVIWKHYVLGMTFVEIGEEEFLTSETVRQRCKRARKYIRRRNIVEEN